MDDPTQPHFKRGRGRPPTLPNGLKAQKLDGGRWKDELGNIWNHDEATATARKRAVEKYSAKLKRERAAARQSQEKPRAAPFHTGGGRSQEDGRLRVRVVTDG